METGDCAGGGVSRRGFRRFGERALALRLGLKGVVSCGRMEEFGVLRLCSFAERRSFAQDDGLRRGQGGSGFFDDGRRRAGVWALGEFGGGEEFGVAAGAVARTQEVEEALLADGDVGEGGWGRWRSGVCGFGGCSPSGFLRQAQDRLFGSLRSLRMTALVRMS